MSERPSRALLSYALALVEHTRERWKGDPDYVRVLDAEIYALKLALEQSDDAGRQGGSSGSEA